MDNKYKVLEATVDEPLNNDERLLLYSFTSKKVADDTGLGEATVSRARVASADISYGSRVKIRQYLHEYLKALSNQKQSA